jgi:hypothetical protein
MREALNILGFGPCHHMRELIADRAHRQLWRDVAAGAPADWNLLLGNYGSCVDWPSAYYWPQLIKAFPDAQVILTWRTAESWWSSFEKTILQVVLADTETEETAPGSQLVSQRVFGGKAADREYAMAVYEANVAAVREQVPPERLLVHKLGDDWEPLCAHLGVPVPDVPYPSRNNSELFQTEFSHLFDGKSP